MHTALIRIKRGRALIALFILILTFALSAAALTDASSIEFKLSIDPAVLKEPGQVNVTATVTNNGAEDISVPMTLYDPAGSIVSSAFDGGVLAMLKAGESAIWEGRWQVSQQDLEAGKMTFNLRLNTTDAAGAIAQVSLPATANISYQGDRVSLQVTRVIQPEIVRANSDVKVSYELLNTGTVRLTDISVRENRLIATAAKNADPLDPGQRTTVEFVKKAGNTALESSALITYKRAGVNTQLRETVETVSIPLARPGFTSTLSADKSSVTIGETITLTLQLENQGNISYTDIDVTDPILGNIWMDLSLPAGESLTQTKEVTMMAPTTFRFRVALSDNTGTQQTENTNEVRISAYQEGQQMKLNVQAEPDRTVLDTMPGVVRFTLTVTNDSNTEAKPVNIYHGELRVASYPSLLPGQSVSLTRDFNLSQGGRYVFSARTVDALDNTVSFEAEEVNITYNPPTPAPTREVIATVAPVVTHTLVPEDAGGTLQSGSNALFILTVLLGLLFAGALLLVLISGVMRLRKKGQSEAAYDHLQSGPKRDYADPSTYQSEEPEAPAAEPAEESATPVVPPPDELPHQKYLREDAPKAETAAQDAPLAADESGYRLTREEGEENMERRSRRAAKHQKTNPEE